MGGSMEKQVTDRQLRELDRKKEWCLTILRFLVERDSSVYRTGYGNWVDSVMYQYATRDLKRMRGIVEDIRGWPRGLPETDLRELNALLKDKFGEDLETQR